MSLDTLAQLGEFVERVRLAIAARALAFLRAGDCVAGEAGAEVQLRALEVGEPDLGGEGSIREPDRLLVLSCPAAICTEGLIAKLKELLAAHPGRTPVELRFIGAEGSVVLAGCGGRKHAAGCT